MDDWGVADTLGADDISSRIRIMMDLDIGKILQPNGWRNDLCRRRQPGTTQQSVGDLARKQELNRDLPQAP